MTSQSGTTLSSPRWGGFAPRHQAQGAALIALTLAMWALFVGTVGAPLEPTAPGARAGAVATSR